MLSDPWNLNRLESQSWTRVGPIQPGRVPCIETPLKPVLLGFLWLGPESLVHPDDGGLTLGLEDQGKVTRYPGPWCWGPQWKPPS